MRSSESALVRDLRAIHARAIASLGPRHLAHLRKMEWWGRACSVLGYATAWIVPNPLSALLIALGSTARWTMLAHHVSHRGYDRVPGVPARYTSRVFARGWRRFIDWPEWMHPDAWSYEHNVLHHYHTGEALDPDLLERNAALLRNPRVPIWLRYVVATFVMATWKLLYYAPNTLAMSREHARATRSTRTFPGARLWNPMTRDGGAFWWRCVLPYAAFRFGLIPALFLAVSPTAWACVLVNSLLAEVIGNLHTFAIIVPNHAGADVTRFDGPARGKADFYQRQIVGSVNYTGGSDFADFLQGFLNYQIEHHLFPELPMLSYREMQPEVEAACRRHGVAYVSEPVLRRFTKMLDIMVGRTSMRIDPSRLASV